MRDINYTIIIPYQLLHSPYMPSLLVWVVSHLN